MSSGGQQSTQTSSLPPWLSDAAQQYLGYAGQVAGQPYQQYTGQRVSDMSPVTRAGIQGTYDLAGGSQLGDAASRQVMDTLQGNYANPFQQNVADRISTDTNRNYYQATANNLARFKGPNRMSSAYAGQQQRTDEALARGLADGLAPVYSSGYENERNRQQAGTGQAVNLLNLHNQDLQNMMQAGQLDTAHNQALLNSQYGDFQDWRNYPNQQLGVFGNAIGSVTGAAPRTQTTQGPGTDPLSAGLGTIALSRYLGMGNSGGSKSYS